MREKHSANVQRYFQQVAVCTSGRLARHLPVRYRGLTHSNMYTIVNITIAFVCLLSISGILYKLAYTLFAKISIIRQQHEATNAIQHQLQRLSTQERFIMDIALSGGNCGVWMPRTNAAVLTLLHKGLLVRISEEETFADWEGERELCTLMIIPEDVRNIIDT